MKSLRYILPILFITILSACNSPKVELSKEGQTEISSIGQIQKSTWSFFELNNRWPTSSDELKKYIQTNDYTVSPEIFERFTLEILPNGNCSQEYRQEEPNAGSVVITYKQH